MNVWDLLLNSKETKEDEDEQDIKNAIMWLKAAGFPQYVQMFNDNEFPISLKLVQEDHMDFDGGALIALFRRIEILNSAAEKKISLLIENSSTIFPELQVYRKPYYEIIEDENEQGNEDENSENEEDDDNDKENILEQTALSAHWLYEPKTRRWSHIDTTSKTATNNKLEEFSPQLDTYLGVPFPRPFSSSLNGKSLIVSPSSKAQNLKRPSVLAFDSFRSIEPIIELNTENSDLTVLSDNDELNTTMSSLKGKCKHSRNHVDSCLISPTSPDSVPKDSLKVNKEKDKVNSHILRSTSLKMMKKAVSRINHNQMSLRHKKEHKQESITPILKPLISPTDPEVPSMKLCTQIEEFDLSKLKLPDKSTGLARESCSIADSGWSNIRTGSFICRNGCTEDEFKSPKNYISSDLDPVIRRLESDVDSLNDLRSRIKSKASPDSAPSSPVLRNKFKQEIKKDHQRLSDFESYTRSNKGPTIEFTDDNRYPSTSPVVIAQSLSDEDKKNWSISSKLNRNNISRWSHTSYLKEKAFPQYHHILELSVNKINILKNLSVLSCTSMLEKYCPSNKNVFNWRMPRLLAQKQKLTLENSNFVFGVNLSVCQNRFGQPFPPNILNVFQYLREHGPNTQGIFRKTGMKCRIKELREEMEKNENWNNFEGYNVNDVADILKTFFRDLPDRLLTNKLSSTLLAIYNYVPPEQQFEGLKWALFSLPDENRVVLEYLIEFLSFLSTFSEVTKMDVKNISLCFAPSLFNFQNDGSGNNNNSPLRLKKSNGPNPKLLAEQNAAHLCVMDMINNVSSLFQITDETLKKASHNSKEKSELKDITHLVNSGLLNSWIAEKMNTLKTDATIHKTGWTNINKDFMKKIHGPTVVAIEQLSYRKIGSHHGNSDGVGLRTWKIVIDIDVPPGYLFTNIRDNRHLWDPEISSTEIINEFTDCIELVRFTSKNSDGSFVARQFNVLRGHQLGVNGSVHMIFSESINVDPITLDVNTGTNQAFTNALLSQIFCDNFMIEALHTKLTRVTWISRVDLCGHHSDWYTNHWGHSLIRRAISLKNFSKANCSLRLSSESGITNLSDSALSPEKVDSCPNINPQTLEFAPETVL